MKLNKKSSILSLFLAGTVLFSSVAIADVAIGNGYNGVKHAIKYTTKTLAKNTDSFSLECNFEYKIDGKTYQSNYNSAKVDLKNQKSSNITKSAGNESYSSYSYEDAYKQINKSDEDDNYYMSKLDNNTVTFEDPFEEDVAADVEKITDAFVSNMKDFVQIKDKENGSKLYYGSMESSQIPAFANAVSSVAFKYSFLEMSNNRTNSKVPQIKDNVYVKSVTGKISENKDGIIDSAIGSVTLSGTDKNGNEHEMELNATFKIYDINNTVITEPKIDSEHLIVYDSKDEIYEIETKDAGMYSANIVKEIDGKYQKVGEKILDIKSVDGNKITATLTITGDNALSSDIVATKVTSDEDTCEAKYKFTYKDSDGNEHEGFMTKDNYINQYNEHNIMVYLNSKINDDGNGWSNSPNEDDTFLVTLTF